MKFIKREIISLISFLSPFALLWFLYDKLPNSVPTHFNMEGVPDGYSDKSSLIWIVLFFMAIPYLTFMIIPLIDPKQKLNKMGGKLRQIKNVVMIMFGLIGILIVYSSYEPEIMKTNILLMLIALLFIGLGNYFQTIKPNYFIGIRTPWTLENEAVWNKTHKMGGKVWVLGGIILFLLGFVISSEVYFIFFIAISLLLALIPSVYSYFEFKKLIKSQ